MAALADLNNGVGGFASTRAKPLALSPQTNHKNHNEKNPLSPTPGSQLQKVLNSINMVVSAGPGPSCWRWLSWGSNNAWEVDIANRVHGGTIVEVKDSTKKMNSSSITLQWQTLELVVRIGPWTSNSMVD